MYHRVKRKIFLKYDGVNKKKSRVPVLNLATTQEKLAAKIY